MRVLCFWRMDWELNTPTTRFRLDVNSSIKIPTQTSQCDVVLVLDASVAPLTLDARLTPALSVSLVTLQVQCAFRVAAAALTSLVAEAPVVALTLITLTPSYAKLTWTLARLNVTWVIERAHSATATLFATCNDRTEFVFVVHSGNCCVRAQY